MRVKLIKHSEPDFYFIANNDGTTFATTDEWYFNKTKGCYKPSKQNCDEIFGVVDIYVDGLDYAARQGHPSPEGFSDEQVGLLHGYIDGFNKAMELNKDKVFTLEDMRKAYYVGYEDGKSGATFFQKLIQSIQQPTEIEVMIVMETCSMNPLDLDCDEIIERPKLDSEGCLILKKI
jgi:hypothetical protein